MTTVVRFLNALMCVGAVILAWSHKAGWFGLSVDYSLASFYIGVAVLAYLSAFMHED